MKWLGWLPSVAVPTVIAVGVLTVGIAAAQNPSALPKKTPEQVVTMIEQSSVPALSGIVRQSSDLGLPELPKMAGPSSNQGTSDSDAAALLELFSGSHTARVFLDGPTKARVQVQDTLAERDLVRNGGDVWSYDSKSNTATQISLPARTATDTLPEDDAHTPPEVTRRVLAAIDPNTKVSLAEETAVAGRSAYQLVLDPRSATTLVDSVSIAVDAETGLPLRVEVHARDQHDPAFQVAFTSLNLEKPPADRFVFSPPPGATVKKMSMPAMPPKQNAEVATPPQHLISGSGWDTVIRLPAGSMPAKRAESPLLTQMSTAVAGGRLVRTSLVNILVTDDGSVFAGAVAADQLLAANAAR
ncbi:MAG: sigma-E factor regulatory protein RseB domain-containing protein [Microbacteriaceae bacterium]